MIGFVFIGPLLLAAQTVIKAIAQIQLASDFVADSARGGDIYTLLDDLIDDSTLNQVGLVPDPAGAAGPGGRDGLRPAATRCGLAC